MHVRGRRGGCVATSTCRVDGELYSCHSLYSIDMIETNVRQGHIVEREPYRPSKFFFTKHSAKVGRHFFSKLHAENVIKLRLNFRLGSINNYFVPNLVLPECIYGSVALRR
jgi:hypothetical protein